MYIDRSLVNQANQSAPQSAISSRLAVGRFWFGSTSIAIVSFGLRTSVRVCPGREVIEIRLIEIFLVFQSWLELAAGTNGNNMPADCLGRTGLEWLLLALSLTAAFLIHIGYSGPCEEVPLLKPYLVAFGAFCMTNGTLRFALRLDHRQRLKFPPGVQEWVGNVVQAAVLPLAIWGAFLTWPHTHLFKQPKRCDTDVYTNAFFTATITLGIGLGMTLAAVRRAVHKRGDEMENSAEHHSSLV